MKVYERYIKFEDSSDYNARLRGSGRVFPAGAKNVTVSYTYGYAEIPADLQGACIRQVLYIQNTLTKQGVQSETNQVAQATTSYIHYPLAPAVRSACNRYRPQKVAIV